MASKPTLFSLTAVACSLLGISFSASPFSSSSSSTLVSASSSSSSSSTSSSDSNIDADDAFACLYVMEEEAEALECIASVRTAGIDKESSSKAVEFAMSRAWWEAATKVVDLSSLASVDLSTAVHQTSSRIRGRLQTLSEALSKSSTASGIPPAFEWAQSPDTLFMNVKFAHKLDTPATLGCEAVPPIFGPRSVTFRAECKEKKKTFVLDLPMFREVSEEGSTWSLASVGRASLTIRKSVNGTWPRLLHSKNKPGNMHVWWAMKEKYEKENEEWDKKPKTSPSPAASSSASTASAAGSSSSVDEEGSEEGGSATTASTTSTASSTSSSTTRSSSTNAIDDDDGEDEDDNSTTMSQTSVSAGNGDASASTSEHVIAKNLKKLRKARVRELAFATGTMTSRVQIAETEARTAKRAIDERIRAEKEEIDNKFTQSKAGHEEDLRVLKLDIEQRYAEAMTLVQNGQPFPVYLMSTKVGGSLVAHVNDTEPTNETSPSGDMLEIGDGSATQ